MAKFSKMLEKNEKRLNISEFLPKEIREVKEIIKDSKTNEDIIIYKDDDYITIKKLPRIVKTKIRFLNQNMFHGQKGKEVLKIIHKKMKQKDMDTDKLDKMTPEEQLDLMISFNLDIKDYDYMGKTTAEVEKYYLIHGIDSKKHSFVDEKNKKIELTLEFWDYMPDKMISYIVSQIKLFSKGVSLGE